MKLSLEEKELLNEVCCFARQKKARLYLVGGVLRDLLIGRQKENPDFDFSISRCAIKFGAKLAQRTKAGFVVLDKEHGACRLVKKIKDRTCTLDFTDFRGKTITDDLLYRDFTINALALEPERLLTGKDFRDSLIDPYGAEKDIGKRIIRLVNKRAFSEDPLRILRAFTFSCILGFTIESQTLRLAQLSRKELLKVSSERIRDELFKMLDASDSFECLCELDKRRILGIILPEIEKMRGLGQGPYHHLDIWQHTLETLRQLELLMKDLKNNCDIQDYLNEDISAERKRRPVIKLGAILHDIGKPQALRREEGKIKFHGHERIGLGITESIARRLKLSNDEIHSLSKIVLWHLRPGFLADNEILTARAKFRYFRDAGCEAVSVLLLSIADQRATRGRLTTQASRVRHEKVCHSLIKEYFKKQKEKKPARLVNGDDLIKRFGLEPSVLIGKILSRIEELQAIGRISTRQQAFLTAKKIIGKQGKGRA